MSACLLMLARLNALFIACLLQTDAAGPIGSQRAFIQARQDKVDVESKVGKTEIVTAADIERGGGAGYYCEVCACLLKDSASYLDHINGKKRKSNAAISFLRDAVLIVLIQIKGL
jgi:hypothetical protein